MMLRSRAIPQRRKSLPQIQRSGMWQRGQPSAPGERSLHVGQFHGWSFASSGLELAKSGAQHQLWRKDLSGRCKFRLSASGRAPGHAGGVLRLRLVGMVDVVMMRFVMDAMMMSHMAIGRMVLIAPPWVQWATGLCRRKRSDENDHSECNFQVHDFSSPLLFDHFSMISKAYSKTRSRRVDGHPLRLTPFEMSVRY